MNPVSLLTLAGMAVVLVASLIGEYAASRPENDTLSLVSTRSSPTIPARAQLPPSADTQVQVNDILARPLFAATRRPPPVASITSSGPAALPRLSAVLVSGHGRTVIFAGGPSGKPVSLVEGGRIGAYVVQSIGVGQATLAGPDGVRVLRPTFEGAAAGTAAVGPVIVPPSTLNRLRQRMQ